MTQHIKLPTLEAKAPYYIELLDRHGEVKTRHRFEQLPINIGSAYANDVILDDAAAAQYHAVVEATQAGALHIRELGSQHGMVYQGKRVAALDVDGNSTVKLGHTQVRVRSAAFTGTSEVTNHAKLQGDGFLPAIIGLLLVAVTSALSVWISNTAKFSMASYLFALVGFFSVVLLWSGCWAFANRVVSGQARFGRHILIVACALVLIDLWAVISMVIAYAFSLEFLTAYGNHIVMVIVAMMVFYHLTTLSDQHNKRFTVICSALMVLGSGLILLSNHQRSGSYADELYMTYLLPPALRQASNQPADAFIQDAQALKEKLDKARSEPIESASGLF